MTWVLTTRARPATPGGVALEWWKSTASPTDMARMWARAKKLRTPVQGSTLTRARSAIPNCAGSDFINQYCGAIVRTIAQVATRGGAEDGGLGLLAGDAGVAELE